MMLARLRRWWSEMTDFLDPWDAELDADEAELARFRMRATTWTPPKGRAMPESETTFSHDYRDCPILACPSCTPSIPAWVRQPARLPDYTHHQWPAASKRAAVVHWLIAVWPDGWYWANQEELEQAADALLSVRERAAIGALTS